MNQTLTGQAAADRAFTGLAGLEISSSERELITEFVPAGVVLFARNLSPEEEQIKALTADLQDIALTGRGRKMTIAIDQEGGTVKRLPPPFGQHPDAASYGPEFGARAREKVYQWGVEQGRELARLGITMDFAPVADVNTLGPQGIMARRSFAENPQEAAALVSEAVRGLHSAGLAACAKHFPGIGHSTLDSHQVRPVYERSLDEMEDCELIPFRAALAAGVEAVMISHLLYPALDPDKPASLSRKIMIDLLRRRLGFSGLIMSDDLGMGAITVDIEPHRAAHQALEAGADIVLICQSLESYAGFVEA